MGYIHNWVRKCFFAMMEATADWFAEPRTSREEALIRSLRQRIGALPPLPAATSESSAWWLLSRQKARQLMLHRDARHFLRWEVIVMNMFPAFNRYLGMELTKLKASPDYESRWKQVLRESSTGRPLRFLHDRSTSGAAIHAGYHAKSLLDEGVEISDFDAVFEFGGGYGKLCSTWRKLGFKGDYVLFDLPEFSALQRFYLSAEGFPEDDESAGKNHYVSSLGDFPILDELLGRRCLFVATWSFSETPLDFRRNFEPLLARCTHFLVGYFSVVNAGTVEEVDNARYFEEVRAGHSAVQFHDFPIEHMPEGNRYMMGKPVESKRTMAAPSAHFRTR